MRLTKRES